MYMGLLKRYLLASRADRLMNNSYGDHIVEDEEERREENPWINERNYTNDSGYF